jgi:hypothetical protein
VSNLERRASHTPRRARERRAYRLAVTGGGAGLVAVAGLVLAIVAAIVAAVCALLFRRTVSS